ncbi:hypothetical protein EC841_1011301 [Raoultella ornithinolytica]|jgi:hypothetical protein|uniref:Uncharacterized protein n=1 Tax=Raoultella ornithinolytica TaxID=54291 RepID=A0ABD7QSB8_RAOOR|nr:hypothetical protein EC841_1011301 [Raoultella ornithinolytica]
MDRLRIELMPESFFKWLKLLTSILSGENTFALYLTLTGNSWPQ